MELELKKKGKRKVLEITIQKVVLKLFSIMRQHIGRKNAVERSKLFYLIYGVKEDDLNDLQYIALWDILKRAMHKCRQRTKCFITNQRVKGIYQYFVIKDTEDANCYANMATRTIKQLNAMTAKAYKSAREEWHQLEWVYNDEVDNYGNR
jgi:hypothetical protein